ncbi:hypothetical protein, partial [Vibrio parahaemolyticus]|uniref:hypothetical protein n=1 Tax=Vibrio parahaemolyticus TaxID=670 RepID=UPI001BB0BA79
FLSFVAMKLSHGNPNVMVVIVLMLRASMIRSLGIHLYGVIHLPPVIFAPQKAAVVVLQLTALALGVVSPVGVMPVTLS